MPGTELLRTAGLRVTRPRLTVLEVLHEGGHLDVDQIATRVRARLDSVSGGEMINMLYIENEWEGLIANGGTPLPFPEFWTIDFGFAFNPHLESIASIMSRTKQANDDELATLFEEAQHIFLEEAPVYQTLMAPVHLVVPEELEGVSATRFGIIRFHEAHYAD
jgi:hypothetical protein